MPLDLKPPYHAYLNDPWVEATLQSLTPRQQLAQLIHVAGWSNRGAEHEAELLALVADRGIGGIIFFQGSPERQLLLTQRYQAASQVPLLISIDAEWGLGMRLNDSQSFPYQQALGAIRGEQGVYDMAREIGRQCRRLGIHMNFAPCVDVNVEPSNPVIGFRSFGNDPLLVARKSQAYMEGLQDAGVLAVAKHFPGHGDTRGDSHHLLPTVDHTLQRLEQVEWLPFRRLIQHGVAAIMTGHIRVPSLDPRPNVGATLSGPMIQGVIHSHFGYDGLVITDALDMKGVTAYHPPGEIELLAYQAGNDILLFPSDVRLALLRLEKALDQGEIELLDLARRCRKVLAAKRWAEVQAVVPSIEGLHEDLHRPESAALIRSLHSASLSWNGPTLSKLSATTAVGFLHRLDGGDELRHHQLSKGSGGSLHFLDKLRSHGWRTQEVSALDPDALPEGLDRPWVLSIHGLAVKAKDRFGLSDAAIDRLEALLALGPEAIVLFASPHALTYLQGWEHVPVLHAFQHQDAAQDAAAEVLLGRQVASGVLMG